MYFSGTNEKEANSEKSLRYAVSVPHPCICAVALCAVHRAGKDAVCRIPAIVVTTNIVEVCHGEGRVVVFTCTNAVLNADSSFGPCSRASWAVVAHQMIAGVSIGSNWAWKTLPVKNTGQRHIARLGKVSDRVMVVSQPCRQLYIPL